jgi:hypothetical protein
MLLVMVLMDHPVSSTFLVLFYATLCVCPRMICWRGRPHLALSRQLRVRRPCNNAMLRHRDATDRNASRCGIS